MVRFLRGMESRVRFLESEKKLILSTVESMEEAIERNTFARHDDNVGPVQTSFSPDKIFRVLLNARRDVEEETKEMVVRMKDICLAEDQIEYVKRCMFRLGGEESYALSEVYIKGVSTEVFSLSLSMSKSSLYRLLRSALGNLLEIYNSGCRMAPCRRAERLMRDLSEYLPGGYIE